jgi:hypothetical protein
MSLNTLSVTELWHLAKSQYQRASYQSALDTFHIISEKDSASLELLEYLASTCSKLSKWEDALKWGRHAIGLDPRNARGYLCVGKILQKMGKKKRAIAIYDVGCAKVLPMDAQYSKLLKVRDQATGTESKANNRDPMEVLPAELLLFVFEYVGFREMVKCLRISKGWKSFLTGFPELWRTLDLSKAKPGRIKTKFINSCIKNSAYSLETANLGGFSEFQTYMAMAKCCKSLKSLEIPANCSMGENTILQVIDKMKSLEKLLFGTAFSLTNINRILSELPKLKELRLWDLRWESFNRQVLIPQAHHFPRCETLKLLDCRSAMPVSTPSRVEPRALMSMYLFEEILPDNLPAIETLIFSAICPSTPLNLEKYESLKQLQLINCTFFGDVKLPPNLTDLLVSGVDGKKLTAQNLTQLDRLEIGECKTPQLVVQKLLCEETPTQLARDELEQDNMWRRPDMSLERDNVETVPCSKLKTFKIESRQWLASAFDNIMRRQDDLEESLTHPRLSEIENLVLKGGGVDDGVLESVMLDQRKTFTSNLRQIAFDTTKISGLTVKLLIEKQEHLQAIWLVNCENVGEDTVEWAREKGVDVQVRRRG